MVIHTILTCVIHFFRTICAAFVSDPSRSNKSDLESGVSKTSRVADVEVGRTSAGVELYEAPPSSYYVFGRKLSRKISTVRPVKTRIVDAVLRNVRDKRSCVLKEVVIRSSSPHLPWTAKVEVFPGPTPSRAPISSALKVLKSSGERVVKFVMTPTFLLDADLPSQATHRSDHSIEDIINLFPSPPVHVSVECAQCPNEANLVTRNSAKHLCSSVIEENCSSISSSGTLLSVDTATTTPPRTPELNRMTRMMSASNGIGTVVGLLFKSQRCRPSFVGPSLEIVESADVLSFQTDCSRKQAALDQCVPSCCNQAPVAIPYLWNNGHTKLDSVAASSHLLQDDDVFSAKCTEGLTFSVTQNCLSSDMTSKDQAMNPETSLTAGQSNIKLM